eukprot:CCRYP_006527-RA/>CCRYP_006527-RA protein AED:0.11 eAED:0.11 QI:0/-1/0/1/-1/1/1/0/448
MTTHPNARRPKVKLPFFPLHTDSKKVFGMIIFSVLAALVSKKMILDSNTLHHGVLQGSSPRTVQKRVILDPHSVQQRSYDKVTFLEDGTAFLFLSARTLGPSHDCSAIIDRKDEVKRIHYHVASCNVFDKMFGNRLGTIYGMKMIANALRIPFEFTCTLTEGQRPNGAAYLMNMNSNNDGYGPPPSRDGKEYTAEEVCRTLCSGRLCSWNYKNLDLASDDMVSDWKHLTSPEFVPIPDHDDAVIHLRLGDGLYSTFGQNEEKGLFPHGTYIKLLKQAQQEKGIISSIGIVTAPFKGAYLRSKDAAYTSLSEMIALDLVSALQTEFPEAEVRLHNSPNGTIMESLARTVHARKVAVCGCSTFCPYALLATDGIGFIYNPVGAQNGWVRNAAERYDNFRLFDAPLLNGLVIHNEKTGDKLPEVQVLGWVRKQDPDVGNIDICTRPIFRNG